MLAFLLFLSTTTPAERLESARRSVDALEYDAAADELMFVVTDASATDEERFEANVLAGIVNRIVGRDLDARLNFRYVLWRRPDYSLPPQTPPKVLGLFELVRQEIEAERAAHNTRSAPQVAPAPPPPTAPVAPPSPSALPSWVMWGSAAVLVTGAVGALTAEAAFADGAAPYRERERAQQLGPMAWAVTAAGALGLGVGAVWWLAANQ